MLSDRDLAAAIGRGDLGVEPYEPEFLQPSSIDLRLGRRVRTFLPYKPSLLGAEPIDPAEDQEHLTKVVDLVDGEPYLLRPGELVLAHTYERITIGGQYAARVEGKSSLGRIGLAVHVTAGFIDPGFSGFITMELFTVHGGRPTKLWPGMKIGQLCVFELSSRPTALYGDAHYGSHYQGQEGPTLSRGHKGFYRF